MIDGIYAAFSSALPLEWAAWDFDLIEAMPFEADAAIKHEDEIKGNIMLCIRSEGTPFLTKIEQAAEAGASAVIVANTDDSLIQMAAVGDVAGYKSKIPVLMIKHSDISRLREYGSALIRDKGMPRLWFAVGYLVL